MTKLQLKQNFNIEVKTETIKHKGRKTVIVELVLWHKERANVNRVAVWLLRFRPKTGYYSYVWTCTFSHTDGEGVKRGFSGRKHMIQSVLAHVHTTMNDFKE